MELLRGYGGGGAEDAGGEGYGYGHEAEDYCYEPFAGTGDVLGVFLSWVGG